MIILGERLSEPVKFVLCHTPDGKDTGGTGLGIRIAKSRGIPVFNLYHASVMERMKNFLGKPEEVDLF